MVRSLCGCPRAITPETNACQRRGLGDTDVSTLTDAMHTFVQASNDYRKSHDKWFNEEGEGAHLEGMRDAYGSTLAQAGDVLERELVVLIRKHAPRPIYGQLPPAEGFGP